MTARAASKPILVLGPRVSFCSFLIFIMSQNCSLITLLKQYIKWFRELAPLLSLSFLPVEEK